MTDAPPADDRPWTIRTLERLLPDGAVYVDELSTTGRKLVTRLFLATLAVALGTVGLVLLKPDNWGEVVAGALIAWSVAILVWARASFVRGTAELEENIRRAAELDLLHGRLNLISKALNLPILDLDIELQGAIDARAERLAHYAALDEYRHLFGQDEAGFWTDDALGRDETS